MLKQKFGVDFDGVVSDLNPLKIRIIKEKFGVNVLPHQTQYETIINNKYLTIGQYNELAQILYETKVGLETNPTEGVINTLWSLKERLDVTVVTSRTPTGVKLEEEWCKANRLEWIKIVGTNRKEKTATLEGFTYYVDDSLKKLLPLIGKVPNLFLFSWPYNADEVVPPEITRVWSWKELQEKLVFSN